MRGFLNVFAVAWLMVAGLLVVLVAAALAAANLFSAGEAHYSVQGLAYLVSIFAFFGIAFGLGYFVMGLRLWRAPPSAPPIGGQLLTLVGFVMVPLFLGIVGPTMLAPDTMLSPEREVIWWPAVGAVLANGVALAGLLAWVREAD